MAGIGHNSKPTREEVELSFRERTREQRIKEHTPFDLKWQWEVWLSDLPSSAMLVAFAIRIYANNAGSESSPSLDTLAMMTKLSRRHVQDSLKLLETHFVRKSAGAGRAPNRYALIIPNETLQELAVVIDMHSRAPRASQADRSEAPHASQKDSVAGHRVPHKPVVGQTDDRSRAPGATDITRDLTTTAEGAHDARFLTKALAMSLIAATAPLPAVAEPVEPPAIVQPLRSISLKELSEKLFAAGGNSLTRATGALESMSVPWSWIEQGCDLELDILPTVRARAAKKSPQSINSWNFFAKGVADAKATRLTPMPQGNAAASERSNRPQGDYSYNGSYVGQML